MMELDLFEETLVKWLQVVTQRPVGLAELPGEKPNMPYVVLTPINSPRGYGSYADPECMREYVFQTMSVGKGPRQARWCGELVRQALIGRNAAGRYLHELFGIEGATVLPGGRESDSLGAIIKTQEGSLFQIVDTYRVKVE
jgi:hypothetical protein